MTITTNVDPNEPLGARDARAEARAMVGAGLDARVLEPSPPAVAAEPFADDPTDREGAADNVVMPAGLGSPDWNDWLADHPEQQAWVAARWLGGHRRLGAAPPSLASTRVALHRLAAYVIAPLRYAHNGRFGLRFTLGGFGTPFFGDDRQIRVVGDRLVDQRGDQSRVSPITTLAAAAEFLETEIDPETAVEHDSPPLGDVLAPLGVDLDAAAFLGDWFGMAFAALERLRHDADSTDPSRPQLWPGHFDPAIEAGDEDHRASYGASPGDAGIGEPYLYVSLWWPDRIGVDPSDPVWDAPGFTGAVLRLSDFPTGDPVDVAADFYRRVRDHAAG